MARSRPDPFTHSDQRRYLVLWDLNWHIIECRPIDPGTDLRNALLSAINEVKRDGWSPEGTADFGFVFMTRANERRLLMLTCRSPHERSSQSFNPLQG